MNIDTVKLRLLFGKKSQLEVARESGVSQQTITNLLNKGRCSSRTVVKIADALDVDPMEFLIVDEEEEAEE